MQHKLPAPVHALSLQSLVTEPLTDAAAATASLLMTERKQGDSALELIERLSARLGEAQVQAWQPAADHRPEHMQRWVPAQGALKSIAASARPERARGQKSLKNWASPAFRTEALYPSWLLPEAVKLAVAGNSPLYQGKLVRLAGPQRLVDARFALQAARHPRLFHLPQPAGRLAVDLQRTPGAERVRGRAAAGLVSSRFFCLTRCCALYLPSFPITRSYTP
ncbi:MAG: hypothetical protein Q8O29_16830 [Polaromonas sp.]|uniref:hypothetical protein n=1 Tax=Polaromonas sp. TaxID=1869339 RepID=UPI00273746A3|nr:hypothetical protein [Polaromonas sp.]MDP2819898.1 hypothetical protein [Polaromonas sp.]